MDAVDVVDEDVLADKLRLTQILLNILGNCVKYNKIGGTLRLRLYQEKPKKDGYATYHFICSDTGIGMSDEFQKYIFETFSRAETATVSGIQGSGLGMAITKRIVDMMQGSISLKSEVGVGSEFDVCLSFPLSKDKQSQTKVPALKDLRVLIADDDLDTCTSIAKMLRQMGVRSEWTVSGKEAIIRAKLAKEIGDDFYAYIIDWLIPDMNGIETVRRIRSEIGDTQTIIILTAYDWNEIEQEAKEAGVTTILEKPLFASDLREVLLHPTMALPETHTPHTLEDCKGKKILLVEDNSLNQEIAKTVLEEVGFIVDTADDGIIAVDKIKKAKDEQYDLILMDIQMPLVDGYTATKQIRNLDTKMAKIPIIAMTANAFEEDKEKALVAGMNGFLIKPVDPKKLIQTIHMIIQKEEESNC